MNQKKLCKSFRDRKICGVCGGFGEYLGIDSTIVRLIVAIAALFSCGTVLLAYLLCVLLMPEDDGTFDSW